VAAGRLSVDEAAAELARHGLSAVGDFARLDVGRRLRTGVPEIVFAQGKSVEQLVAVVTAFLSHVASVFCSRVSDEQVAAVRAALGEAVAEHDARSRVLVVRRRDYVPPPPAGAVGILAAGTSDVAVAEEAAAICREMGVAVHTAYDVGVAGAHRIGAPLRRILDEGAAALIVAAGMEGALPSLVAGMVDVPVIGLPTSTGYGLGGAGEAALLGMLQSCAPGLVVVNIDNGVGAGATAAIIARRFAGAAAQEGGSAS
jgi:NCAIR mutase (PurE)-related protein